MKRSAFQRTRCLLNAAQRDPAAFELFYAEYGRRVLLFFARRVIDPEAAYDLTSETFAKALEHRDQFRGRTAEEEQGWLFAIARSELSRFWRRGSVEKNAIARLGIDLPGLSNAEMERIEELAGLSEMTPRLEAAMRSLPSDQREAVRLRVVDEVEYGDLATRMGVTEEVARARVSRGLRALARQLSDADATVQSTA